LEAYLNDKLVCNSEAEYGGEQGTLVQDGKKWESISRIDQCIKPVPVKKGDLIKMVAVYNTEKHPL
jgi:hypothetical protein